MNASARLVDLLLKYFRVEVKGIEKLPRRGPAVIIANHSGFSGFDAVALAYLIHARLGRRPRIIAHRAYFEWFEPLRKLAEHRGLRRARVWDALKSLRDGHLVIIFPEGEAGNFKSSLRRYQLQRFHSGFVRMALMQRVRIFPCLIIGAEESFLNWGNINLGRWVKGLRVPVPVTLLPLPARWKIEFLDPIRPSDIAPSPKLARNREFLDRASAGMRQRMQRELEARLKRRRSVFR